MSRGYIHILSNMSTIHVVYYTVDEFKEIGKLEKRIGQWIEVTEKSEVDKKTFDAMEQILTSDQWKNRMFQIDKKVNHK